MNHYGVIMAGGGGTRFWPLSRQKTPKQLLKHFHKMKEYVLKEWKENSLNKLQVSNVNKEI